jgi:DNA-binding transcriptional MocR family regulator
MPFFNRIYEDDGLPNRAKLVYVYLYDRQDEEHKAWPGINRIASDLSLSRSTVKRAIADLVKAGYVRKEAAYRERNQAGGIHAGHLRGREQGAAEPLPCWTQGLLRVFEADRAAVIFACRKFPE